MSLVGSSVKILPEGSDDFPDVGVVASTESYDDDDQDEDHTSHQEMVTAYQDGEDAHPPPTPPGAAEALFLSGLPTQNISAAALAEQIHARHRPLSLAGTSIATDDFASATDALHAHNSSLFVEHDGDEHDDADEHPFGNDALIHSREVISEDYSTMAKTMTTTTPTVKTTTTEPMHVDAAEKIYDTAKGVWGWGKGVILFSPFMGIAEGIAGKIVETAGSSMEDLDTVVLEKLHGLDDSILNPAIATIVGTLLSAKDKTQGFVVPILETVLGPLGLLKDKPEAESTLKPDGTTMTK